MESPSFQLKRVCESADFSYRVLLCLVILSIIALGDAAAETYYIRADGTAWNKGDATSCSSPSTSMAPGDYQNNSFNPGDRIVFCHEGGVFRTTVYVGNGGLSGAPITFDGRGTAVFSGSDIVSGWTRDSGDVWVAHVSTEPQQVFIDGTFGDRKGSRYQLQDALDWYWTSDNLYLYSSAGDPDGVFNDPGVESSARHTCFGFGGQDYIVFDGFTFQHTNFAGLSGWGPGSHVTIRNSIAQWNWEVGIDLNGDSIYEDALIENNIIRYNGTGGIALLGAARNSAIRRNDVYGNGKYQSMDNEYSPMFQWTFGIKLWEGSSNQEGNDISFNNCYDNGRGQPGDYQGRGVGIWLDGLPGNPNNMNLIRHNLVHENTGNGIFIEISSNSVIQGNVLFGNATNTGGGTEFAPASIAIDSREHFVSQNNLVYNNTSVGGRYGIKIVTYDWQGCAVNNNIVKNNIFVGASEHNLFALFGGENDGSNGNGNIYENNNFGEESPGFIQWGWTEHSTYETWESAYGQTTYSVEGDPMLVGNSPHLLYLSANSPGRNAGVNLGQDFDDGLSESSSWPAAVVLTDQDSVENGWELGAYCYTGEGSETIFVNGFENSTGDEWNFVVE